MRNLLLVAVLLAVGSVAYAQGTPDGETPANEGVCDVLIGKTPGLYGLCVAYCEAMDCDLSVEGEPRCKNASPRILDNYKRKMQSGDPDMPWLLSPPQCPCFSLNELLALQAATDNLAVCHYEPPLLGDWGMADAKLEEPSSSPYALAEVTIDYFWGWCEYHDPTQEVWRSQVFSTVEEAWACFDVIWQACLERGACAMASLDCPNYPPQP